MKRLLLLLCILSFLLTGCSVTRKKPPDLSVSFYRIGLDVLEVTDDYLDGKILPLVAAGQIQDLCRNLTRIPGEQSTKDQHIQSYCEILGYTLMLIADGDHVDEKKIITTRNSLAELLGESFKEK